jgi:hypothetical protein
MNRKDLAGFRDPGLQEAARFYLEDQFHQACR